MPDKDDIARILAIAHQNLEATITTIVRLVSTDEEAESEPIKLLEVNSATSPSGIWPVAFSADPPEIPYATVVVEVTPKEYEEIRRGQMELPEGWRLGDVLYGTAA